MVKTGVETLSNVMTENTDKTEQAENKILLRICELAGMAEVEKEWEAVLKVLAAKLERLHELEKGAGELRDDKRLLDNSTEGERDSKKQCCGLQNSESTEEQ